MALSSNHLEILRKSLLDNKIDYVRFTWCDLNGISKCKIVPAWCIEKSENTLKSGVTATCNVLAFGPQGIIPAIEIDETKICSNCIILPAVELYRDLVWASEKDCKIAQVICETFWMDRTPQQANPRFVARAQLTKLKDLGYKLLSAFENEFVLKKDGKFVFDECSSETYNTITTSKYESFLTNVEKNLRHADIMCPTIEVEFGGGQFEITIECNEGIKAADDSFTFKEAIKEMAQKCGMSASFMSKISKVIGSSSHFNHSIKRVTTEDNAFFDASNKVKMSDECKHWMAGLIKHARALTAFYGPTTNCYDRLHNIYCPTIANWGFENRLASFRLVSNSEHGTYIENRIPSAASNPYLVLAATVAAGIDGLVHKLECPPMNDENAVVLPKSLEEALDDLEKDTVLCKALGKELVEWFCITKRVCEIKVLKTKEDAQVMYERII
ncbi:DgyrCDS8101 [Dimorphilus gyrociliatus]|uniref:Lengsin n=1 Tax=Dimorphilus gyrociliatus TaxID=2664684 RepID=A0A7I8VY57_9ANNE|nr:DgyrCDS8101 [Dimorphilus gyrociliatus]